MITSRAQYSLLGQSRKAAEGDGAKMALKYVGFRMVQQNIPVFLSGAE